jgi:hypothetical protein
MDAALHGIKSVKKLLFPYKGLNYSKIRNFMDKNFKNLKITYLYCNNPSI